MYTFKPGDKVKVKESFLKDRPDLKGRYEGVLIVGSDNNVWRNNGTVGLLKAISTYFEYANPIWLKVKDTK